MVWLIGLLTVMSYSSALWSLFKNEYRPSLYSRIIWLFIAVNNFASVVILKNSSGIKAMVLIALLGNVLMLAMTLRKSKRVFGKTELASSVLLIASLIVWITTNLPLLNLTIGLIAHFIGGIPTIKKVAIDPRDEHFFFWFWFLLAGALALTNVNWAHAGTYLYPLYVVAFDGLISLLCLRRFWPQHT